MFPGVVFSTDDYVNALINVDVSFEGTVAHENISTLIEISYEYIMCVNHVLLQ